MGALPSRSFDALGCFDFPFRYLRMWTAGIAKGWHARACKCIVLRNCRKLLSKFSMRDLSDVDKFPWHGRELWNLKLLNLYQILLGIDFKLIILFI